MALPPWGWSLCGFCKGELKCAEEVRAGSCPDCSSKGETPPLEEAERLVRASLAERLRAIYGDGFFPRVLARVDLAQGKRTISQLGGRQLRNALAGEYGLGAEDLVGLSSEDLRVLFRELRRLPPAERS